MPHRFSASSTLRSSLRQNVGGIHASKRSLLRDRIDARSEPYTYQMSVTDFCRLSRNTASNCLRNKISQEHVPLAHCFALCRIAAQICIELERTILTSGELFVARQDRTPWRGNIRQAQAPR